MITSLRRAATVAFCAVALAALCQHAFADDRFDEQLVKKYFPQKLVESSLADEARGGPPPRQYYVFKRADLDRSGRSDHIVAVYTNTLDGAVRLIRSNGSTDSLAAEAIYVGMDGIYPGLDIKDLDGDGVPEIIASFDSEAGHPVAWIFRWSENTLKLISPIEEDDTGVVTSLFFEPQFIDIDGDGMLEVVIRHSVDKWTPPSETSLYKLSNGIYAESENCSYFSVVTRSKASSEWEDASFAGQPGASGTLTVLNGFTNGNNRVSSATIELNGTAVATPDNFNQLVDRIQRQVTLQDTNTVRAKLEGAPGSRITVKVGCAAPTPASKKGADKQE